MFVDNGDLPPRSHDLRELVRETYDKGYLQKDQRLSDAALFLRSYATTSRYVPFDSAEKSEALGAVVHCNRLSSALYEQGYESVEIRTSARVLSDLDRDWVEPKISHARPITVLEPSEAGPYDQASCEHRDAVEHPPCYER